MLVIDIICLTKLELNVTEFANELLQNKGGTVVLKGKPDVLNRYKHLDPSINQQETTNTRSNIPPVETLRDQYSTKNIPICPHCCEPFT
jgi:hypothetical protein